MRDRLLALLRVPERPEPPPGSGAELETFRAEKGFLYYSVLMWFPKQAAAFVGLMFSLSFFGAMGGSDFDFINAEGWDRVTEKLAEADIGFASLRFDLGSIIWFFEALAIGAWAAQLLFTSLLLKLSWELRWYMVGERSLRIRHGLWSVREQTMTIANIQNMSIKQGPLQRMFGFSDLEIRTAGGGSGSGEEPTEQKDSFHVGRFRGLANASAWRDKIRARLQADTTPDRTASGKTGLEMATTEPKGPGPARAAHDEAEGRPTTDLLAAAETVLAEARALRRAVTG